MLGDLDSSLPFGPLDPSACGARTRSSSMQLLKVDLLDVTLVCEDDSKCVTDGWTDGQLRC